MSSQSKNKCFTQICSGFQEGSYLRLIDVVSLNSRVMKMRRRRIHRTYGRQHRRDIGRFLQIRCRDIGQNLAQTPFVAPLRGERAREQENERARERESERERASERERERERREARERGRGERETAGYEPLRPSLTVLYVPHLLKEGVIFTLPTSHLPHPRVNEAHNGQSRRA